MNQYNHLIRLEREIERMESWMQQRPDKVRDEIKDYLSTLKSNYHAITGKPYHSRQMQSNPQRALARTSADAHSQGEQGDTPVMVKSVCSPNKSANRSPDIHSQNPNWLEIEVQQMHEYWNGNGI